jgi:hypothetical protein
MTTINTAAFSTANLTFVTFHDDNSVSAYLGSTWLCNEASREEAEKEARFIISAFDNGAGWARSEFPSLAL